LSASAIRPRRAGFFMERLDRPDYRFMAPRLSSALLCTQSDERLAALAGAGHERAFEAIVGRYRRPLERHCRRLLPPTRAEDAVQQVFLRAWSALSAGSEICNVKAWLYRIATNAALDLTRQRGYDYDELPLSLQGGNDPPVELDRRTEVRAALGGLAQLPQHQREALVRIAIDGASVSRVAEDLDVSEGAVRQLVHRARCRLRAGATVITPLPLAVLAARRTGNGTIAERVAHLGANSSGLADFAIKGTVVVVASVAIASVPAVERSRAAPLTQHRGGVITAEPRAGSATEQPVQTRGLQAPSRRRAVELGSRRGRASHGPRSTSDGPSSTATTHTGASGVDGGTAPPGKASTSDSHAPGVGSGSRDGGGDSGDSHDSSSGTAAGDGQNSAEADNSAGQTTEPPLEGDSEAP
jgi:RNA polymerase sigma factor (sigma-70 family)